MKFNPLRGEVYLMNFDPSIDREIGKIRPAIIVQNNIGNKYTPYIIVCPLSTQLPPQPTPNLVHVYPPEANLKQPSVIICNLIHTFDQKRLIKKLGTVNSATLDKVELGLKVALDL